VVKVKTIKPRIKTGSKALNLLMANSSSAWQYEYSVPLIIEHRTTE
jgi:hypothetical protein